FGRDCCSFWFVCWNLSWCFRNYLFLWLVAAKLFWIADSTRLLVGRYHPTRQLHTLALKQAYSAGARLCAISKIERGFFAVDRHSFAVWVVCTQLGDNLAAAWRAAAVLNHHAEHRVALTTGTLQTDS